jgi:hypothetical protein
MDAEQERFALYRLCECTTCGGSGKGIFSVGGQSKCAECRGEGRTRDLIATCATAEAVGVALVTLGREGEWEGCPVGLLDRMGAEGERWLLRPWSPSARNVSDAARVLAKSKTKEKT